jgi:hypothetical protein
VVATDGKQLLVQRGFAFPWKEDLLVPRLSAVGLRELQAEDQIGVGRTDKHVVLRAGPWTFALGIDASSRYPDVAVAIPRATPETSRLQFDDREADYLISVLPKLPGAGDDLRPITLDLSHKGVCLRSRGEGQETATETSLTNTKAIGPPVRVNLNRAYLRRALQLGLRDLQIVGPDKPLVFRSEGKLYVVMTLDKGGIILPARSVPRLAAREPTSTSSTLTSRSESTMPVSTPGRPPTNGNGATAAAHIGIDELIEEGEQLRTLLHDCGMRLARLVAALKQQRRQSRAVKAAVGALQQLRLEP